MDFPSSKRRNTLRIAAAALGRGSLVRELLKANADVDIPNQNGAAWTELNHLLRGRQNLDGFGGM